MITSRLAALTLLASWLPSHGHGALREARSMKLHSPRGQYRLSGPLGERVAANTQNWLLPAPQANPGMLEMFRLRDRQPPPDLVPWAGEFVGKYLTSAIGALRLTDGEQVWAISRADLGVRVDIAGVPWLAEVGVGSCPPTQGCCQR